MEKTKFIQREDVQDVLDSIFSEALEHAKEIDTTVCINGRWGRPVLSVVIRDANNIGDILAEQEYEVIDGIYDGYEVERDTIEVAIERLSLKDKESIKEA